MQFLVKTPERTLIIYTNRKVMSSTLERMGSPGSTSHFNGKVSVRYVGCQVHTVKLRLCGIAERFYCDYGPHGYHRYLLVRHPLRRLESLYRNLLLSEQVKQLSRLPSPPESIRSIGSEALDVVLNHVYGAPRSKQIKQSGQVYPWLSFRTWIEGIDQLLKYSASARRMFAREPHLRPQYRVLYPGYTRLVRHFPVAIKYDRSIKIDKREDFDFLSGQLGFKIDARHNVSHEATNIDVSWTTGMRDIAYRHYRKDFELFGYSPGE